MKTYEKMDWLTYEPNLELVKKAANEIADRVEVKLNAKRVGNLDTHWEEERRHYTSHMVIRQDKKGMYPMLHEMDGHYFSITVQCHPEFNSVLLVIEEVDFGHYHRFTHFFSGMNSACDNCPDDVVGKLV